jgi:hypothetical protein
MRALVIIKVYKGTNCVNIKRVYVCIGKMIRVETLHRCIRVYVNNRENGAGRNISWFTPYTYKQSKTLTIKHKTFFSNPAFQKHPRRR